MSSNNESTFVNPLYVQAGLVEAEDWAEYLRVRDRLLKEPLRSPGRIKVLGWDVEYVSGPAIVSAVEYLVLNGVNNFQTKKESPLILDCGANVGISVLNYKRLFPNAKIVAFEPDPEFAPVLRRNLERNGAVDVEVVQAAVWVEDGEARWYCQGIDGSKLATRDHAASQTVPVRTVDLSRYLTGPVDLLKLDIEGAEYEVVNSLNGKLRNVVNVIIECHVDNADVNPFASLLTALAATGFSASVNSLGVWRDLVRQPEIPSEHFGQYLLVAAWREPIPSTLRAGWSPETLFQREIITAAREEEFLTTQAKLQTALAQLQAAQAQLHATHAHLQAAQAQLQAAQDQLRATQMELAPYQASRLVRLARKIVRKKNEIW